MADIPDKTPALQPPDGIDPDFDDPSTTHIVVDIVGLVCLVLCIIVVALRTLARTQILKTFDTTDRALLWSVTLMGVYVGVSIHAGQYGQGKHQWNVPLSSFLHLLKIHNVSSILYGPLMFPAKYAVLRQIEAIFFQHRHDSLGRRALMILIWGNFFFYAGITVSFICACIPREGIWNPAVTAQCIDTRAILVASSALNIMSDLTALALPLVTIWGMQMPFKSKLKAFAMFSIGTFANFASIIRLYYTLELIKSDDITTAIDPFAYWTHIEFTTVVTAACAPLLPVSFRHLNQKYTQLFCCKTSDRCKKARYQRVSQDIQDSVSDLPV